MNDCHKVRCLYSVFLEGEASLSETVWFEEHLARCPGCRTDYAAFTATTGLLRSLPRHEASPGFEDQVLARVRSAPAAPRRALPEPVEISLEPRWWEGWMPRLALGGVAAALMVVGSLTVLRGPVTTIAGGSGSGNLAENPQQIETLEQLYPDLSPEKLRSMQSISRDGVLDRVVIQPGSPEGGLRVVSPVDHGSEVYVTF
jgi:hypothetical protein